MRFLKRLGNVAGQVVGGAIGGSLEALGTAVDSNFIKEVGQGVYHSTVTSTETLGSLADGAITAIYGIATEDEQKIKKGLSEAGNAVKTTAIGVGRTINYTAQSVGQVFNGLANDNLEMAGQGARNLAKVVAISTLAVGLSDIIIGSDAIIPDTEMLSESVASAAEIFSDSAITDTEIISDAVGVTSDDIAFYEKTSEVAGDVHHVEPHWVSGHERAGIYIEGHWRDGDGNTSVNLSSEEGGGYLRSNPST
jgi:hypothetical protein